VSGLAVANHIHPIAPHPTERTQDSHPYPPQPKKTSRHYDGLGVRGVIGSIVIKPKNPQGEWWGIFQNGLRSYSEFLKNWPLNIQGMTRLAASKTDDHHHYADSHPNIESFPIGARRVSILRHQEQKPKSHKSTCHPEKCVAVHTSNLSERTSQRQEVAR